MGVDVDVRKVVGAFVVGCCVEGRNEGGEEVVKDDNVVGLFVVGIFVVGVFVVGLFVVGVFVPVIGNIGGGLIGEIISSASSNSSLNISNCYSSSPLLTLEYNSEQGTDSIVDKLEKEPFPMRGREVLI